MEGECSKNRAGGVVIETSGLEGNSDVWRRVTTNAISGISKIYGSAADEMCLRELQTVAPI